MAVEWYYATSKRFTFGFEVTYGRVIATAPIAYKKIVGYPVDLAIKKLESEGYTVIRGDLTGRRVMEENEPSEFVKRVQALPGREKLIYVRITFLGWTEAEVAANQGLPESRVRDIYLATRKRVETQE